MKDTLRKDRDLIFNKIITFSNSITYFRNRTLQFCNLFIYHLPPSVILSVNKDSFWNLSWSGKSAISPFLTHFYIPDMYSLKTECSVQKCNHCLTEFWILFSKTRNRSPFPTGKYVKIQYWDQKCDISDNFWNCFNYSTQCVILSIKDSYVQKIIVKDSSVNDFDLLTQAFVYYVSNIGHQNHWRKAYLRGANMLNRLQKKVYHE